MNEKIKKLRPKIYWLNKKEENDRGNNGSDDQGTNSRPLWFGGKKKDSGDSEKDS